ncbi:MAG: metalloregulator ArsR/SmtB family transcription factor [Pseudomonadota bacterium]
MDRLDSARLDTMNQSADRASALMKTLGHKGRLLILCQLATGEKSVGELSRLLDIPQSPLSQHLSRMRSEGLVEPRRDAQTVYYSLTSGEVRAIIECLYELYCADEKN